MRTLLSTRRAKFQRLIVAAHEQPTEWLENNVRNPGRYATPLGILACLRSLCGRNSSGRPYREKRRAILANLRGEFSNF